MEQTETISVVQDLMQQDKALTVLKQMIDEKDKEIANLRQVVKEKDERIDQLTDILIGRDKAKCKVVSFRPAYAK